MDIQVRPVARSAEGRYQARMVRHHYLGALAKIGETVWYVSIWREQWLAQVSLSAAALQCGVRVRIRDRTFVTNLARLGLSLAVWPAEPDRQQQPLPDPPRLVPAQYRFPGVIDDRAAGGRRLADTVRSSVLFAGDFCCPPSASIAACIARTEEGYREQADAPRRVFVRPLFRDPSAPLTHAGQDHPQLTRSPKIMRNAEQMRQLPQCFTAPRPGAAPSSARGAERAC